MNFLAFLPPAWLISFQYSFSAILVATLPGLQDGKTTQLIRFTFVFPLVTCALLYALVALNDQPLIVLQFMVRWEREISWAATTSSIWLVARHYLFIIAEHAKQHDSLAQQLAGEVIKRLKVEQELDDCRRGYDESA